MVEDEFVLDASGLNCPLPIMKVKKLLEDLAYGQTLKVITTDPGSAKDFSLFCLNRNCELVSSSEDEGHFVYILKKIE